MPDIVSTESLALPSWSCKIKKAAWIGLAIVGFLVALILVVPHFVDLGRFKRTYLPLVEEALNRRLDVGEVRLSLVPTPSIRLSNLKVFDAPAYSGNTFFAAEQVRLRLRLWPLLRGHFEVTELLLDKPVFNLLKQPDGTFNYSDIAAKRPADSARRETRRKTDSVKTAEAAAVPIVIPQNVSVSGGQVNVLTRGREPGDPPPPGGGADPNQRHRFVAQGVLRRLAFPLQRIVHLSRTENRVAGRQARLSGRSEERRVGKEC